MTRGWTRYAVLFVLGAALTAVTIWWGINPPDEGLMLQAGARVADGQLPYHDFYANYGPGQYFLTGALNLVFGPSLVAWRVVRVVLDGAAGVLAYALARRDAPEPLALGAWLAVAGAMAYPSLPSPTPTVIVLCLGAILLARRRPAASGALAGLTIVFRPDLALAPVAGAVIDGWNGRGLRGALRIVLAAAAVATTLLAPLVLADPREAWDQTFGFAFGEQRSQRIPLPGAFPHDNPLQRYIAYPLLAALAIWLVAAVRSPRPLRQWALFPMALTGVAYLLSRTDDYHLIPLAAVLPIMLAAAAARERAAGRGFAAAVLAAAITVVALHGLDRKRILVLHPPALSRLRAPSADGIRAPAADARALNALVPYVQARVRAGQPIFVANPRYDLVTVGDPLIYVLVDRPNPTRYDTPGIATTVARQREIVADLERARPRVVVRWLSPLLSAPELNGRGHSSGVRILERWIATHYRERRRFGEYAVLTPTGWARSPQPNPAIAASGDPRPGSS